MATVEERVASGAYMLDVHVGPEWRDKIDLNRLETRSCEDCVLGQVYGEYSNGLVMLGIWGDVSAPHMIHQSMLGFAINQDGPDAGITYDEAFARLDAEWIRVLA